MTIQIYDNFLPLEEFERIEQMVRNEDFYQPKEFTVYGDPETNSNLHDFYFQGLIYEKADSERTTFIKTHIHFVLTPLWEKLQAVDVFMARVNCQSSARENYQTAWHTDMSHREYVQVDKDKLKNFYTACFYLNTNNGGTTFRSGEFCPSVKNRICIFPHNTDHAGVWCTDTKLRYVLNLNYEKKSN